MSKRNAHKFKRPAWDYFATPWRAAHPLGLLLPRGTRFVEPCAGSGDLIRHLETYGHRCHRAFDVEPREPTIATQDALTFTGYAGATTITNPPFSIAEELLQHMLAQRAHAVWFLLPLDWLANLDRQPMMTTVTDLLPTGRVKWFPDSKHQSNENFGWLRFTPAGSTGHVRLHRRYPIPANATPPAPRPSPKLVANW